MPNKELLIYITLILPYLMVSCNESNVNKTFSSQPEYTLGENGLDYEFILEDEPGIATTYVVDSLLFTIQSIEYPYAIKVFNKHDLRLLGEFGDRDGPDMLRTISYNGQFFIDEDGIKIGLGDNNRPIWWILNLSKSIESGETVIEEKVKLPNGDGLFHNSYRLTSSLFVGNTTHTRNIDIARLKFIDVQNDSSWLAHLTPNSDFVSNLNVDNLNYYYGSSLCISPNGEHIISSMYRHDRIDIYNNKGELQKSIIGKNNSEIKNLEQFEETLENGKMYYHISIGFEKFFLATYLNGLNSDQRRSDDKMKEIKAYDYNGQQLFKIVTPYSFFSISLDTEEGVLYGYIYDKESVIKINIMDQLTKFNLL